MSVRFIRSSGNDLVFGKIKNLEKTTKEGLRRGMFKAGQGLRSEASRAILKDKKTGVVYNRRTRTGGRRRHQASAAGETHANMTGTLRRSLSFQLKGTQSLEFGYGVSSGNEAPKYAKFVEFGTKNMKPRPSLKNALNAEQGNIVQHFGSGIKKAFK